MSIVRTDHDLELLEQYISKDQYEKLKELTEKGLIPSLVDITYPAFMAISMQEPKILSEPATAAWLEEIDRKFREDGSSITEAIRPHLDTMINKALEYEGKRDSAEYKAEYKEYLENFDTRVED